MVIPVDALSIPNTPSNYALASRKYLVGFTTIICFSGLGLLLLFDIWDGLMYLILGIMGLYATTGFHFLGNRFSEGADAFPSMDVGFLLSWAMVCFTNGFLGMLFVISFLVWGITGHRTGVVGSDESDSSSDSGEGLHPIGSNKPHPTSGTDPMGNDINSSNSDHRTLFSKYNIRWSVFHGFHLLTIICQLCASFIVYSIYEDSMIRENERRRRFQERFMQFAGTGVVGPAAGAGAQGSPGGVNNEYGSLTPLGLSPTDDQALLGVVGSISMQEQQRQILAAQAQNGNSQFQNNNSVGVQGHHHPGSQVRQQSPSSFMPFLGKSNTLAQIQDQLSRSNSAAGSAVSGDEDHNNIDKITTSDNTNSRINTTRSSNHNVNNNNLNQNGSNGRSPNNYNQNSTNKEPNSALINDGGFKAEAKQGTLASLKSSNK